MIIGPEVNTVYRMVRNNKSSSALKISELTGIPFAHVVHLMLFLSRNGFMQWDEEHIRFVISETPQRPSLISMDIEEELPLFLREAHTREMAVNRLIDYVTAYWRSGGAELV